MKTIATFAIACIVGLTILSGMAVADERMDVSTDKTSYVIGESITINVVNMGNEPVQLNGYWVEDANEVRIYTSETLGYMQYLDPGESYRYVWNQMDDSGTQVSVGAYTVNVDETSASFEVINDPVVLTTTKDSYEMGESVDFAVTNTGESSVSFSNGYAIYTENGELVYAENTLNYMTTLQPGESISYLWSQKSDNGERVLDGTYIICVNGQEITIYITAQTPAQDQLWDGGADNGNGQVPDLGFIKKPLPRQTGPRI